MTAVSSLGTNKIVLDQGWVEIGLPGSYFTAVQSITIASAGGTVLPAGVWIVMPVTNVSIEISEDGSTWSVFASVATIGQMIVSDGYNVRLSASAAATGKVIGLA